MEADVVDVLTIRVGESMSTENHKLSSLPTLPEPAMLPLLTESSQYLKTGGDTTGMVEFEEEEDAVVEEEEEVVALLELELAFEEELA